MLKVLFLPLVEIAHSLQFILILKRPQHTFKTLLFFLYIFFFSSSYFVVLLFYYPKVIFLNCFNREIIHIVRKIGLF